MGRNLPCAIDEQLICLQQSDVCEIIILVMRRCMGKGRGRLCVGWSGLDDEVGQKQPGSRPAKKRKKQAMNHVLAWKQSN